MISCAFGACRRTTTEYRFVAHPLGTVDRVLVAAPACLDRFGPIATKADLVEHPFIHVKGIFANEQLPLQSEDNNKQERE